MKLVKLYQLKDNGIIWRGKIAPLTAITDIKKLSIADGFKRMELENHSKKYYFGSFRNQSFLLGEVLSFQEELSPNRFPKFDPGIAIKLAGRLGGINKARSITLSKIRTNTINIPIDYKSLGIQTKWGLWGIRIQLYDRKWK